MFGALGDVACAGVAEHEREGFFGIYLEDRPHLGAAPRDLAGSPPYEGGDRSPSGDQGWFSTRPIGRARYNGESRPQRRGLRSSLQAANERTTPSPKRRHPSFVRRGALGGAIFIHHPPPTVLVADVREHPFRVLEDEAVFEP